MSVWDWAFELFLHSLIINGLACLADRLPIAPLSGGHVWFLLLVGYVVWSVVERKRNEAKLVNRCPNCDSYNVSPSGHSDFMVCNCCGCLISKRSG